MTFKNSTLIIIAAYIYIDIFCVCALPVRLERQTSGSGSREVLNSMMKNALITLRDLANRGLPENALHFYDTCHFLRELTRINDSNVQECQENVSNGKFHTIKDVTCSLLNELSGWNFLKDDGSCSDSTLDLFCTKTILFYDTDSAQTLLSVHYDECKWVNEIFEEEPEVAQEIKDSIRQKLFCPSIQ